MTTLLAKRRKNLPTSIDEDPHVQRHTRQLRDLDEKLAHTAGRHANLLAERQQLRRAQHEVSVAIALGDAAGVQEDPGRPARLVQLETEILAAAEEESALRDARERLVAIAAGAREIAQKELEEHIVAAVREVIATMQPLVEQLSTLNQELTDLANRVPYGAVAVPNPGLLLMWTEQARAVGGR
jgi:hypothetical protein